MNNRLSTTLRWLALPCLVAAGFTAWYVNREIASPFEQQAAEQDRALVGRGEYVARLSDCVACHSLPGQAPFAGGLEMATPLGAIHATNITPDRDTGIGAYTLADFDRAVRHGVAPGGRRLYPAMPYPSYGPTRLTPSSAMTTCARCTPSSCKVYSRSSRPISPATFPGH